MTATITRKGKSKGRSPKEELYHKSLEDVFGKESFEIELEDYEESKFLVVKNKKENNEYEPCLFISINKRTGVAKGFSSNPEYKVHASEIKKQVEMAYRQEKYSTIL